MTRTTNFPIVVASEKNFPEKALQIASNARARWKILDREFEGCDIDLSKPEGNRDDGDRAFFGRP
jgi:hypothetical protein